MKIALLGYGKEGQATEKYFKAKYPEAVFDVFEKETPEQLRQRDYSSYDIIFRSPSIPPFSLDKKTGPNESADSESSATPEGVNGSNKPLFTSMTKYFFDHCPCPIIGVTATKGKGTTCSFIKSLLDVEGADAYLVGNIGTPSIEVLDQLTPDSIVVYEMSSFQLWDLDKSPHIAVVGQIEPDHLNVHKDYADYLEAKANICRHQTENDFLIYYSPNPDSRRIAEHSVLYQTEKIVNTSREELKKARHIIPYPIKLPDEIRKAVKLPGEHNLDNAIAAVAAVACWKNISPDEYIRVSTNTIIRGLSEFKGLPHRLEFLRELNGIKYYDDNFSTGTSSTRVAVNSFPNDKLVMIIGGRDKTGYEDLPEIYEILDTKNISKIILIGEMGRELARKYQDERFISADTLEDAVNKAKKTAEESASKIADTSVIVLMSPAAASFDMFESVYDRGDQFQQLINKL